jgi:hypothetical protein
MSEGLLELAAEVFTFHVILIAVVIEVRFDDFSQPCREVDYLADIAEIQGVLQDGFHDGLISRWGDRDGSGIEPGGQAQDNPFQESRAVFLEGNGVAFIKVLRDKIQEIVAQLGWGRLFRPHGRLL